MHGVVLSLCDRTTNMVQPWARAGFRCVCVDTQHEAGETVNGNITKVGADIIDWFCQSEIAIVFAFPPCTNLAVSGARWFRDKGLRGLIDGLTLVERCREICEASGAPWMIENPVSTLSTYWRKPDFTFDPCDYGDPYTKKTCLWTGGGFVMPEKCRVEPTDGSRMHLMSPSDDRANRRSETPLGFAEAVFRANFGALTCT